MMELGGSSAHGTPGPELGVGGTESSREVGQCSAVLGHIKGHEDYYFPESAFSGVYFLYKEMVFNSFLCYNSYEGYYSYEQ